MTVTGTTAPAQLSVSCSLSELLQLLQHLAASVGVSLLQERFVLTWKSRKKKKPRRCLGRRWLGCGRSGWFLSWGHTSASGRTFLAGLFAALLGTAPSKQEVRRYLLPALLQPGLPISTAVPGVNNPGVCVCVCVALLMPRKLKHRRKQEGKVVFLRSRQGEGIALTSQPSCPCPGWRATATRCCWDSDPCWAHGNW